MSMGRLAREGQAMRASSLGRKVAVGYPMGGSVTGPFHGSMQRLLSYEIRKPTHERLMAKEMHAQGLYVGANRQILAERFMAGDSDWLLQIDTDIEFPVTIIEDMLRIAGDERLILGANVPLGDPRLGAHQTCAYRMSDTPGLFDNISRMPSDLFKCDAIATACVLIHRQAFDAIEAVEGQAWFLTKRFPASQTAPDTPRVDMRNFRWRELGEDLSFCIRAADAGIDIWCAYVRGLKHYKTCALSDDHERDALMARSAALDLGEMGEIVRDEDDAPGPLFGVIGG